MRKPNSGGLVYSTDSGRMCPGCRQAVSDCACKAAAAAAGPKGDGNVRVSCETKGRGGKAVTVIRGLDLDAAALAALGKRLGPACGAGGAVKGRTLELRGDHRVRVLDCLKSDGWTVKLTGG
ncbi:MAG: stress response translation initiation inhibitor YciH [Microbacteriaceae bacterium]|nr:stress response translation initiation inhibitor YciH [Burkholderiaceae bacterium]